MKISFTLTVSLLATSLLASVAGSAVTLVPVELNGIVSFFGVRQAFFALDQGSGDNFALAVGESKYGVKLLAIDTTVNLVQIENGGQRQSLRICAAPNLTGLTGPLSSSAAGGPDEAGNVDLEKIDPRLPGNPGFGTLPPLAAGAAPKSQPSPADVNGANPAARLKDQAGASWYQEAQSIEENRRNSAAQVLAGEMPPWPLTPLTPAGTPANLIGKDGLFGNHMPDFLTHTMVGDPAVVR